MKKFNWGHGITIVIILIMVTFTAAFVNSLSKKHELVSDDYYGDELKFQDEIDKKKNAVRDKKKLSYVVENGYLQLSFQGISNPEEGTLIGFRPNDQRLDFKLKMDLDADSRMEVPIENMKSGRYNLTAEWVENETEYMIKKDIRIP